MVNNYNEFIHDRTFDNILNEMFLIVENKAKWLDDNVVEWDLNNGSENKLESFLKKLPKEKVRKYFLKFLKRINKLPKKLRKGTLMSFGGIFLSIASLNFLLNTSVEIENKKEVIEIIEDSRDAIIELAKLNKTSSFKESQHIVKEVEKGYSSDKKDTGNYIKTKKGRKFVGTNHGISAPVLMAHIGKIPSVEEMKNLSYNEALKIYRKIYWNPQNLDKFNNQSIANIIYDGSVNQGIGAMKDIVRNAIRESGIKIGTLENPFQEKWIKEMNKIDNRDLFELIKKGREDRYRAARTFKSHGAGWLIRLNSIPYEEIELDLEELGI